MKTAARVIAALAGVAALGGCNVPNSSISLPDKPSQTSPERTQARGALLYVADLYANDVRIFSYPALKPVRTLSGLTSPGALCVNQKTGDVWVTESGSISQIAEFAHGEAKPIATLHDRGSTIGFCAVDPTGTHIAVTNRATDDPGNLLVFDIHTGKFKLYSDKNMFDYQYVGYEPNGNLFVDGTPRSLRPKFVLDELPSGKSQLVAIPWHGSTLKNPADVQYDGTNLAVGSSQGVIYQPNGGKVVGTTRLHGLCYLAAYFIDTDRVLVPNRCNDASTVSVFRYPASGAAIQTVSGFQAAAGVAISR